MLESTLIDLTQGDGESVENPTIIELDDISIPQSQQSEQQGEGNVDRPWKCELCSFKFKYKNNMLEHVRFFHMKGQVPCNYCSQVFPTSNVLRKHMQEHSLMAGRCPHCRTTLCKGKSVDKEAYTSHLEFCARKPKTKAGSVVHWSEGPGNADDSVTWRCLKCGVTFSEVGNYENHVRLCSHDEVMESITDPASQKFLYIGNATGELVACIPFGEEEEEFLAPANLESPEEFQIMETRLSFDNSGNEIYEKNNNIRTDIGLTIQPESTSSEEVVVVGNGQHETYEETNNIVECTDTDVDKMGSEEDSRRTELEEPSKMSEQALADNYTVMYICKYCNQCFAGIEERDNHKLYCSQEKPLERVPVLEKADTVFKWLCTYCLNPFSSKALLHAHKYYCTKKKQVTGTRSIICTACKTGFLDKASLEAHMDSGICKWVCTHCRNPYPSKRLMYAHMSNCPKKELKISLPAICTDCKTGFLDKVSLEEHLHICPSVAQKKLTSVAPNKKDELNGRKKSERFCHKCGNTFETMRLMLKHRRKCSGKTLLSSAARESLDPQTQSIVAKSEKEDLLFASEKCPLVAGNNNVEEMPGESHSDNPSDPFFTKKSSNRRLPVQNKEGMTYEERNVIKRWMCKYCATCFQNRDDLHAHKMGCTREGGNFDVKNLSINEEERTLVVIRWACKYCGTDFSDKSSLRDHKSKCFWLLKMRLKKARFKDGIKMGKFKRRHEHSITSVKSKRRNLTKRNKKLDQSRLNKMKKSLKKKLNKPLKENQDVTKRKNNLKTIENLQLKCDCGLYVSNMESFKGHRATCNLKKYEGSSAMGDFRVILKCDGCSTIFYSVEAFREHLKKCSKQISKGKKKTSECSGRPEMRNIIYCKKCGSAFKGVGGLCKHPCEEMLKYMQSCQVPLENIFPKRYSLKKSVDPVQTPLEYEDAANDEETNDIQSYPSLPLEVVLEEPTVENLTIHRTTTQNEPVAPYAQHSGIEMTRKTHVDPTIVHLGSKSTNDLSRVRPSVGSNPRFIVARPSVDLNSICGKTDGRIHVVRLPTKYFLKPLMPSNNFVGESAAAKAACTLPVASACASSLPVLNGNVTQATLASENQNKTPELLKRLLVAPQVENKLRSKRVACENKEVLPSVEPTDYLRTDESLFHQLVDQMFLCDGFAFEDKSTIICRMCYRSVDSVLDLKLHYTKEHQSSNSRPVALYIMKHAKYQPTSV